MKKSSKKLIQTVSVLGALALGCGTTYHKSEHYYKEPIKKNGEVLIPVHRRKYTIKERVKPHGYLLGPVAYFFYDISAMGLPSIIDLGITLTGNPNKTMFANFIRDYGFEWGYHSGAACYLDENSKNVYEDVLVGHNRIFEEKLTKDIKSKSLFSKKNKLEQINKLRTIKKRYD